MSICTTEVQSHAAWLSGSCQAQLKQEASQCRRVLLLAGPGLIAGPAFLPTLVWTGQQPHASLPGEHCPDQVSSFLLAGGVSG